MAFGSDLFYTMLIIFVIAGVAVAVVYAYQGTVMTVNAIPGFNQSYVTQGANSVTWISPLQAMQSVGNNFASFDQWIYWIFILVSLATIAAAALLPSNAMVVVGTFVMMVIVVFISFVFSNASQTFFEAPILANAILLFPNTLGLFAYLPYYEVGFFLMLLVVLGAKSRGGGGNPGAGAVL